MYAQLVMSMHQNGMLRTTLVPARKVPHGAVHLRTERYLSRQ